MDEEDSFYMLVSLLDNYQMAGLYKPGLPLLNKYFFQLNLLFKMHLPELHEHFTR
jgi:TBC1 domain family member 10